MSLPRAALSRRTFIFVLIASTAIALFALVARLGPPDSLPTLDMIYERRAQFSLESTEFPTLLVYATGWMAQGVLPVAIVAGLYWRKPALLLFAGCAELVYFSYNGMKTFAAVIVIVPVTYWVATRYVRRFGRSLIFAIVALVAVGFGLGIAFNSNVVTDVITRRTLVVPGQLAGVYADHYSYQEKYG